MISRVFQILWKTEIFGWFILHSLFIVVMIFYIQFVHKVFAAFSDFLNEMWNSPDDSIMHKKLEDW